VQLRPSCQLSSGQGSRWRDWIGRWRSNRAYLRGGWLPNGTGSRSRRGSLRVGLYQPLASSCPGAVPGVRTQRPPPHSDRRRQSDGGLSGLPAPLGSVRRARPPEFAVGSPGTSGHAHLLGHENAAKLLSQTLAEEEAADKKLTTIGERSVTPKRWKRGTRARQRVRSGPDRTKCGAANSEQVARDRGHGHKRTSAL
jgi:hypothetical protein